MPDTSPGPLAAAQQAEPPTGSVVAIDWGHSHQEVWVSNNSNIGNWYTPDIPLRRGDHHPTWYDVIKRAEGRTLTLLVPGDREAFAAGFAAGVERVSHAVSEAVDELRIYGNGSYPDGT